jgi:hypothetical protein
MRMVLRGEGRNRGAFPNRRGAKHFGEIRCSESWERAPLARQMHEEISVRRALQAQECPGVSRTPGPRFAWPRCVSP